MTNYGPMIRIILRYVVGAGIMGSAVIGERLAADPDLVIVLSMALGGLVEAAYVQAKRKGGAT